MSIKRLQTIVGWIIILGHFGIAVYILTRYNGWDSDQKETAILVMAPVTVGYMAAAIKKWFQADLPGGTIEYVNYNIVSVSIFLPLLLLAGLGFSIGQYPSQGLSDLGQLVKRIASLEVVFGGMVAFVVGNLFA